MRAGIFYNHWILLSFRSGFHSNSARTCVGANGRHKADGPENLPFLSLCSDSCSLITKTLCKCQSDESVCENPWPCVHSPRILRRVTQHEVFSPERHLEQNATEVKQIQGKPRRNITLTQRAPLTVGVDGPGRLPRSCPFGVLGAGRPWFPVYRGSELGCL